ncbi:MAG TPA: DinB family protein [Solimonas sp.]
MIDRDYARRLAAYNRWMNGKVYTAAAQLTDAQRKEDRGAFFKSIHATLNHLLCADQIWLRRFTGRPLDGLSLTTPQYEDFAAMRVRRDEVDAELAVWVETLTAEWLAADFSFHSQAANRRFQQPAWVLVTHLFQHQAHHRGQTTTLLSQFGLDVGPTDLPAMPEA